MWHANKVIRHGRHGRRVYNKSKPNVRLRTTLRQLGLSRLIQNPHVIFGVCELTFSYAIDGYIADPWILTNGQVYVGTTNPWL